MKKNSETKEFGITDDNSSGYAFGIDLVGGAADAASQGNGFVNIREFYVSASGHTRLFTAMRYGKRFVLKCLKQDFLYTPVYAQALTKEFEIGLQLEHPYICRTLGMEEIAGLGKAIIMEYVDGDSLKTLIDNHSLTSGLSRRIASQLASALEYIHSKQVIHRDLKPSNIMVTHNGRNVKLIDFGLSDSDAFAILKMPAGTSGYIAPEQLQPGAKADVKADIYSFGMVLRDMAQATKDKMLSDAADVCLCRNPQLRPSSVEAIKKIVLKGRWLRFAILSLSVASLLLVAVIAVDLYKRMDGGMPQTKSSVTNTSDGNTALDIEKWK